MHAGNVSPGVRNASTLTPSSLRNASDRQARTSALFASLAKVMSRRSKKLWFSRITTGYVPGPMLPLLAMASRSRLGPALAPPKGCMKLASNFAGSSALAELPISAARMATDRCNGTKGAD
ncbi:hypothetical protein D3C81_1950230 [compost metagenome]